MKAFLVLDVCITSLDVHFRAFSHFIYYFCMVYSSG